jgi:hypothetical protein
MNEEQQAISQYVEQNVRLLIGDLQMQILVLRATIASLQQTEQNIKTNGAAHPKTEVERRV